MCRTDPRLWRCDLKLPCEYCASRNRECVYPNAPSSTKVPSVELDLSDGSSYDQDQYPVFDDEFPIPEGGELTDVEEFMDLGADYDDDIIEFVRDESTDSEASSLTELPLPTPEMINVYRLYSVLPVKVNMTPLEMWVLHFLLESSLEYYVASRDTRQMQMWDNIRETLFGNSKLMQSSLYAYSGMLMLVNYNSRYLLGESPVDDGSELSVAKVYNFSMNSYSFLLKDLTRQMEPLLANTITRVEAEVLVVSISFLFSIIGSNPVGTCPLVDFNRGGNDFISFCIGFRQTGIATYSLIRDSLLVEVVSVKTPPSMDTPLLPFFARILRYIDDHESDGQIDEDDLEVIKTTIRLLNQHVHRTTVHRTPVAFFQTFTYTSETFWNLVYNQVPIALSWLNALSAFALMFKFCFIRDNNIWVEYMDWCHSWIQHKYPWDEPLYRLVVEQGFYVRDFSFFLTFDPVNTT
ncbi:hypothetical protein DIURU_000883 [Diutina rugosa]|uniref:Zn(2)-C6 fungal-type domain-containing protein n=1 Tax=Diutina rugosa TaxID=5481 RepID=A0A642UXG0_DIURU|nr:uncharacterized protein DIURU_000883 [Diutina rugosa]KAA8907199.1 hypothetical protein DIURU_000883 [Diutina rugosa]